MNQPLLLLWAEEASSWAGRAGGAWHFLVSPGGRATAAALVGAAGIWWMLPGGRRLGRWFGGGLAAVGLVILASLLPGLGSPLAQTGFWLVAGLTLAAAAATVCTKNPVYCAIWFAVMLLGTAGLFLLQGAQFLGVATVVVYAGAIVVTFLFILMLAQPAGHAYYDRISWGRVPAALAALTALVLVVTTVHAVALLGGAAAAGPRTPAEGLDAGARITGPTALARGEDVLHPDHMARLGGQLFSRHLIAVEVAGTMLLVALVGAISIAGQPSGRREGMGRP
jgi:NADH-quinone oxidoreductase subunit J